jgi:hypothetical protein
LAAKIDHQILQPHVNLLLETLVVRLGWVLKTKIYSGTCKARLT